MLRTLRREIVPAGTRLPLPFLILGAVLTVSLAGFGAPSPAGAANCVNPAGGVTVFPPGAPVRQCTIPAGVTRITVEAWGAQGGDNAHYAANTDHGGAGGHTLRTNYPVTAGATLLVIGGQAGGNAGRTDSGGGGGGGSSGVYTYYPARNLDDVVVIAGAGGGAACDDGGWGGGSYNDSRGSGGRGFNGHLCLSTSNPGPGGHSGSGGYDGATSPGGSGFGGNGGASPDGGYGGWGGPDLAGIGGVGTTKQGSGTKGGGGGGGYGGGAGGRQAGGGGGGSYPELNTVSPNWGNGRVQMSVSTPRSITAPSVRKGPRGLTRRHVATLVFGSGEPSRFQCSLTGRRVKPKLRPWRRCGARGLSRRGTVTYHGLRPGVKVFRVKRVGQDGTTSVPQRREWRVVR